MGGSRETRLRRAEGPRIAHRWDNARAQAQGFGTTRERKRKAARIVLSDVRKFKRDGNVTEALKPLAEMATVEVQALIEQLGGRDVVTAHQLVLCEDYARLGTVMRGETGRYLRTQPSVLEYDSLEDD